MKHQFTDANRGGDFERLPTEIRLIIWEHLLGGGLIRVHGISLIEDGAPEDDLHHEEKISCKSLYPGRMTVYGCSTFDLRAYEYFKTIKTLGAELEGVFYSNIIFESNGCDRNNRCGTRPLHEFPAALVQHLRISSCDNTLKLIYLRNQTAIDEQHPTNSTVALPGFDSLKKITLQEEAFCSRRDVPLTTSTPADRAVRLLHFERKFQVDVQLTMRPLPAAEPIGSAHINKEQISFQYLPGCEVDARLEQCIRDRYGVWEEHGPRCETRVKHVIGGRKIKALPLRPSRSDSRHHASSDRDVEPKTVISPAPSPPPGPQLSSPQTQQPPSSARSSPAPSKCCEPQSLTL